MSASGEAWLAVVNPAAGRGRGLRTLPALEAEMRRACLSMEVRTTARRGHAVAIAAGALAAGYRRFLAVGGDGTVNEVANGLLGAGAVRGTEITLGTLPVGTGNDWARTHALPRRVPEVVRLLAGGRTVVHDAGVVACRAGGQETRRFFVNMAGVGIDAHILQRLGEGKGGTWSYLAALLAGLRTFASPALEIAGPDFLFRGRALAVFMGPGRYCGGGLEIAPHAAVDDGTLHMTLVRHMSALQVLVSLPRLFNGTVPQSPHVVARRVSSLEIASDPPAGVEVDGEVIGTTPARVAILPRAIRAVTARPARRAGLH
ncbi:MAG: diacylglycerol kinase family lipid kinase [Burkholderiales bacterium]|nr:diacylglycerol kinase family lipid kinase [Burkholderiales bacterium]